MVNLPINFRTNIQETFGNEGKKWLQDLNSIVSQVCRQWSLKKCTAVSDLSFNYVCTALSPIYGPVILKLGVKPEEGKNEYISLKSFESSNICRCYEYNEEYNALLLERITPGDNLFSLNQKKQQIITGAELLGNMVLNRNPDSTLPSYEGWIKKSFQNIREKKIGNGLCNSFLKKAEGFFQDHYKAGISETANHGDFHHMNILKGKDERWKLIDPQGVIGFRTADSGRFILNQLAKADSKKEMNELLHFAIERFSTTTGIPAPLILKGAYVEKMLSSSWSLEGHISKEKQDALIREMESADRLYMNVLNNLKG